ncbi:hypothetical protein MKOR_34070 [Mycolicibacillus koreensis]|nr:hypothetical protein MKOR_34070 [Mycolicibacillus koreensis]
MVDTTYDINAARQRLAIQDPVTSVVLENIYHATRAEVERRIFDVFPGDTTEAPQDDEVFRWQVFVASEWTWFVIADTTLAEIKSALGITDPWTWQAVGWVVKTHVIAAMTLLRDQAASPGWCESQEVRDASSPQVEALLSDFKCRLLGVLSRLQLPNRRKETP